MNELNKVSVGRRIGVPLSPEERRAVLNELFVFGKDNQHQFLYRMAVLLIASTVIACSGLLADAPAVVIGAMLIAPMMRPVMSAAAAITLGWSSRLYKSLILAFVMAASAVLISALFAWISPDLVDIPRQVIARTEPTFFDLVIALAAGGAGAYTMTRKEASAIPGVAMAVALLPPLASTGILLVFKQPDLAMKALILFFTNFAAMVLAGSITFILVGVSPATTRGKTAKIKRLYLMVSIVLVFGVSVPLYFYSDEVWYNARYKARQSEELQEWLSNNELAIEDVYISPDKKIIRLRLFGPNPPLNVEKLHTEVANRLLEDQGHTAPFKIEVTWTQSAKFSWPPEPTNLEGSRILGHDHSKSILGKTWVWIGTQYADGEWLRPGANQLFTIKVDTDSRLEIMTTCSKGYGEYTFHQENLSIQVARRIDEQCETIKIDRRFLSDINLVVNVNANENRLSLRLNNDSGAMHFEASNQHD